MNKILSDVKYLRSLESDEENCLAHFGSWTRNIDEIAFQFQHARPYESVVIDNVFLAGGCCHNQWMVLPLR